MTERWLELTLAIFLGFCRRGDITVSVGLHFALLHS